MVTLPRLVASCTLFLLSSNCVAPVGSEVRVPDDATATCEAQCNHIGLELSAVAIMANNVGCICQASPSGATAGHTEAVTGGMATIMLQEEQARRQQHHTFHGH
jgi:hypothetical protein